MANTKKTSASGIAKIIHPKDRRISPRRIVHERCPALIMNRSNSTSEPISAIITDINQDTTGFGAIISGKIEPGSKVLIELQSPRVSGSIEAQIAWCAELPITGHVIKAKPGEWRWRVGIQLNIKADTDAAKQLLETIRQFL